MMRTDRTFSMIKPLSVKANHIGGILNEISKNGFKIVAIKMVWLTLRDSKNFYAVHREKLFFKELTESISSGPILVMVLEKEDAINSFRKLIGNTNPLKAEEGTIRKKYGVSITDNAIHGADSDENADREARFYFSERELINSF